MDGEPERGRSASFRRLKPCCVALSKVTLGSRSSATSELLPTLRDVLGELIQVQYLDSELANYVFFPLSRVFTSAASSASNALELSLNCLCILIRRGWSNSTDASLCKQLIILLSFIAAPSSVRGKDQDRYSDIITVSALECLQALFHDASPLVLALCETEPENPRPVFGQCIASILASLNDNQGHTVEYSGTLAIRSLAKCLQGQQLLNGFLPGIASALTRYLTSRDGARPSSKSIVNSLGALESVICGAFSGHGLEKDQEQSLQEWRKEQTPQLKNAIVQLIRLKDHENPEVRKAVFSFCFGLIRECQPALETCSRIGLATAIFLCQYDDEPDEDGVLKALQDIIMMNPQLLMDLNELLEEWFNALPRIALEGDPEKITKQGKVLISAYHIAEGVGESSVQLQNMLFESLQQSIATALRDASAHAQSLVETNGPASKSMTVAMLNESTSEFKTLGHSLKSRGATLESLQLIISNLSRDPGFVSHAFQCLLPLVPNFGRDSAPTLWLARSLFTGGSDSRDIDQFLSGYEEDVEDRLSQMDAFYSQAVEVLTSFDEAVVEDWQLQAISLEIVALMAQQQGNSFQPELVDVLFPVIEKIGSTQNEVREHALTCLNILAKSCGAGTAGELIVQNADYLVNSLALKLNAFQINPQSPKVMVMVIHLCGPSIIPYLDDILESIFSALSSFHGYPRLVDALFSILEAIVDQGSSPASKLLEAASKEHQANEPQTVSILQVRDDIIHYKGLNSRLDAEGDTKPNLPADSKDTDEEAEIKTASETKAEPSKSYQMVQSIARHSQYYLTHASPALRQRLLKLISTASQALARNEDQYLPLVNDVWPVVITRLYDAEASVMLEAMASLVVLFQCAGDFLLSRIQSEWPRLIALGRSLKSKRDAENRGRGGRGSFSTAHQQLEGFVAMLSGLAAYIGATAEMEDDIFHVFSDLAQRDSVSHLLQQVNSDAYWLLCARADKLECSVPTPPPSMPSFQFQPLVLSTN